MKDRSLGAELRAARLGFRWHPAVPAYMRVKTPSGVPGFVIELAPGDALPKMGGGDHRCWWEHPLDAAELGTIARRVIAGEARPVRLRRAVAIEVDDDGRFVRWAPAPA